MMVVLAALSAAAPPCAATDCLTRSAPDCAAAGCANVAPNTSTTVITRIRHMISSLFLTAFYRLPAIYPLRDFAEAGGLVSYGARRLYRPYPQGHTDLPVVQSSKLE